MKKFAIPVSVIVCTMLTSFPAISATQPTTNKGVTPALQASPSKLGCSAYIEKGEWIYRYSEWSLSLTPTDCGRQISSDDTGNMFYEIVKKYSGSTYWHNDRGMINQLTCHLVIARNKPQWNLDPWRPYVGHAETLRQDCNVTVPAPDTPFQ